MEIKELDMFKLKNPGRGIPNQNGIYCPLHDKVYASEEDLEPRQYRNRSADSNFICNWGRGRGMGPGCRGLGRRLGRGQGRGWGRNRIF